MALHTLPTARRAASLALVMLGWAPAGPARADVRPPVEFQLAGPPRAARAGRAYCGKLVVSARQPVRLDSLRLAGEGWRIVRFRSPAPRRLEPGSPLRVSFRAVPGDPARPLEVHAVIGGASLQKWLDLSPEAIERVSRPGSVKSVRQPRRSRRRRIPLSALPFTRSHPTEVLS